PDHLVKRSAIIQLPEMPASFPQFDGDARLRSVMRDGVALKHHLSVTHATYSDMVKMAEIGFNLKAEIVGQGSATDSESLPWELDAVKDFLYEAPEGHPIEVHRIDSQTEAPDNSRLYYLATGHQREAIAIRHAEDIVTEASTQWLVIGSNAEEYLA